MKDGLDIVINSLKWEYMISGNAADLHQNLFLFHIIFL